MNQPNKDLGQHWLNDQPSLQAVIDAADVKPTDTVVEIGPGQGSLTQLLCEQAEQVIAVEFDKQLAEQLPQRVDADNLAIVNDDIRTFDFSQLESPYKVIGNIPYYLTSHLIQLLLELPNPPETISLLVQREVAERVAAEPGQLSILGVTSQLLADVELGPIVPAELFTPPPKVDSQVLGLKPKGNSSEMRPVIRLVKIGFAQRRKQLANTLSAGLQLDKDEIKQALKSCGIKPTIRAQSLTIKQWKLLSSQLGNTSEMLA